MSYLERLRSIDNVLKDIHYHLVDVSHIPGCRVSEIIDLITENYVSWDAWNVLDLIIEKKEYFILSINKNGLHWIRLREENDN